MHRLAHIVYMGLAGFGFANGGTIFPWLCVAIALFILFTADEPEETDEQA